MADLPNLPPDQRKAAGIANNEFKTIITTNVEAQNSVVKSAARDAQLRNETLDVTLPARAAGIETGRIHPISQVLDEVTAIFADMGFAVAEGPDIESDDYNFTKLNFPPGHPARAMQDTLYVNLGEIGRAHV